MIVRLTSVASSCSRVGIERVKALRYSKSFAMGLCSRYKQVNFGNFVSGSTSWYVAKALLDSQTSSNEALRSMPSTDSTPLVEKSMTRMHGNNGKKDKSGILLHAMYNSCNCMSAFRPFPSAVSRLFWMSNCSNCVRVSNPSIASILFFPSHKDFNAVFVSNPSIVCRKE